MDLKGKTSDGSSTKGSQSGGVRPEQAAGLKLPPLPPMTPRPRPPGAAAASKDAAGAAAAPAKPASASEPKPARPDAGASEGAQPKAPASADVAAPGQPAPASDPAARGGSEISGTHVHAPPEPAEPSPAPAPHSPTAEASPGPPRGAAKPKPASGPASRPIREGTKPKDITLTRVRLTDAGARQQQQQGPDTLDTESTGVQVFEQVRLEPGELVVGTRYRIVGWLGEGGMGVVYECEHVDIERRVALKVLRSGVDPSSRRARMFREEARAVSRAGRSEDGQVSNIVEIYDFGELPDGRMWFAMELLHGRSLARMLSEGPMEPARLIAVLRQLCKGLAAAHDANVVHRDIKPGNVMLVRDRGRDDVVKVVDFGVAAVLAEGGDGEVQLEGTPNYMAPEQATGSRFDHRLDIYAVGAVGFHMLAGGPPFQGDDVFQLLRKVCTEPPPRPSELNPEGNIPTVLEDVMLRCLEKDPANRYADMRDLEAALCEAQISAKLVTAWDDLPVPRVEPPARYDAIVKGMPRPSAPVRRPGRVRALAAAAVLALGLGTWGFVTLRQDAESSEIAGRIAEHVAAARAAAAKALYLYPPPDEPTTRTAYVEVVELEGLVEELGKGATTAGEELRQEMAGTLVRLGDQYWDREGGRAFAVDYYIQALVFDPTQEVARKRAATTPGMLTELRRKAATLDFEPAELSASEPLLALAETDDTERVRKLEEIGKKDDELGVQANLRIEKLLEDEPVQVADAGTKTRSKPVRRPDPVPSEVIEELEADDGAAAGSDEPSGGGKGSERSNEYVAQGLAALRSGQRRKAETLFHRALGQDHRNHRALDGLGQMHFDQGDYDQAVQYGKRAVDAAPGRGSYRIHLGDAYFKVFRYKDAVAQYRRAEQLGHSEARSRLQKVESKLGGK
jgi:tetratricopeptide (TPR) repeat protein/tRNA A-37 threonylcarbamoyl transferase component Bud32